MAEQDTPEGTTPQQDPDEHKIALMYNARTNSFRFDGPVEDPVLCYGMLEMGKDIARGVTMQRARDSHRAAQQIARPSLALPPEFQRRR